MSLINQMLKDLDARHESETRGRLHGGIRPLPAAPSGRLARAVIVAQGVLLLGALAWFGYPYLVAEKPAASAVQVGEDVATGQEEVPASVSFALPSPNEREKSRLETVAPTVPDVDAGLKLSPLLETTLPGPVVPVQENPTASPMAPAGTKRSDPSPAIPVNVRNKLAEPVVDAAKNRPVQVPGIEKSPPTRSPRDRAEASYRRAIDLVNGARIAEAIDTSIEALRHDGGHAPSRQLLARLLVEERRYDEASAILAEGLAAQPGQVQWAMMFARLQVERGDHAGASRTLRTSLPYAGGNADYLGFLGLVSHRLGLQAESAEHYRAAATADPADGRWWLGLGLALEADQRESEAREAFQRARVTGTLNPGLAIIVDQKLR